MKKIIIFIFAVLTLIFSFFYIKRQNDAKELFKNKKNYSITTNYERIQEKVDKEIISYINNKKYTLDSPKVILNPYGNSPLTALIIFNTKESTNIKLYVNDVFMTTFEKSNSHILPIYGLRENYNNKIKLVDENNFEKVIDIKTEKLDNSEFYEYTTTNTSNEYLFLNGPAGKYIFDNEGYLSWYMNIHKLEMDITKDKRMYFIDSLNRIIEIDFLGRVYKTYYIDSDSYNHRMRKIDDNHFMLIDSANRISLIDYNTGEIIKKISVYDIFKNIDNNFGISKEMFYVNHFEYDEENKSLLISIRGLDVVLNYDLVNDKIIWLFTGNKSLSKKFDKYKLKLLNGGYFSGQHTPHLIGNKLYIFDNHNYVLGNIQKDKLSYSSAVIYEINGKNIKEIYRYNSEYKSIWYGSFYEKDNVKNINFGNIFNNSKKNYSKVIELDKEDNIITEFNSNKNDILIYESFRESFYNEETPNYKIDLDIKTMVTKDNYISLDNLKLDKIDNKFKEKIKDAIVEETIVEFIDNKLKINVNENFELVFINNKYKYYSMSVDFDIEEDWNVYANNFMSKLNGKYALYIKINDKFYNTNLVFDIV